MKGTIGLILLLIAPLPLGATPSIPPTEMITIAPGEFIMGSSDKGIEWAAKTFFWNFFRLARILIFIQ